MKTDMKDQDLTEKIIGCALKVHNTLRFGFLEKVYENAAGARGPVGELPEGHGDRGGLVDQLRARGASET